MSKKKRAPEVNLAFLAGLYTRVAKQTGVHPSYVSRVARGERRSDRVSRAIADELAQFVPLRARATETGSNSAGRGEEYRQRFLRRLKEHSQLSKIGATILEVDDWGSSRQVLQVSRVNLQARIAANASMIAGSVEEFYRLSRKMESFPHVLSLTDREGVALYSLGSTGAVQDQGRVPGAHWGHDRGGPSAAAMVIAQRAPIIMVGKAQSKDGLLTVRMACPLRLSTSELVGVVVLSVEISPARAQHLIDMTKAARKIGQIVEEDRKKVVGASERKQIRAKSAKAPGP